MSTFFQTQMTGPCSSAGVLILRTQLRQKVRGYEALLRFLAQQMENSIYLQLEIIPL